MLNGWKLLAGRPVCRAVVCTTSTCASCEISCKESRKVGRRCSCARQAKDARIVRKDLAEAAVAASPRSKRFANSGREAEQAESHVISASSVSARLISEHDFVSFVSRHRSEASETAPMQRSDVRTFAKWLDINGGGQCKAVRKRPGYEVWLVGVYDRLGQMLSNVVATASAHVLYTTLWYMM